MTKDETLNWYYEEATGLQRLLFLWTKEKFRHTEQNKQLRDEVYSTGDLALAIFNESEIGRRAGHDIPLCKRKIKKLVDKGVKLPEGLCFDVWIEA